jgi:hypothetical protein
MIGRRQRKQQQQTLSNQGFSGTLWGPPLWLVLHIMMINFPLPPPPGSPLSKLKDYAVRKAAYHRFFTDLQHLLPCKSCRKEYTKMISRKGPLKLTGNVFRNRVSAFMWLVKVHDAVTMRVYKKKPTRKPWEWYRYYDSMRSQ